jgi:rhodanese-related sulfurtransferase
VFTGDCLLINGCGRTDFQGGAPGVQYDSITLRLFTLPDETLVYPGHDYNGNWISCIIQEKTQNPRLAGKTRDEFIDIMLTLNLPKPKLIDEAVPANRYCGVDEDQRQDEMAQGNSSVSSARDYPNSADIIRVAKQQITEISVSAAREQIEQNNICLVDVRETQEYQAGHIDNAISLPRGLIEFKLANLPELQDKAAPILLYCGSGNRSALAAVTLEQLGYQRIMSLAGGFKAWNEHQPA